MGTPYKMKKSPMARNYGAPFKANESVKDNTKTKNVNVPTITPGARAAANEGMNKSKFDQIASGSMTNRSLLNNEGKKKYDKDATYAIKSYEKAYNKASKKYESAVTKPNKNKDKKKSYVDSQTTHQKNRLKKDL